MLLLLPGLEDLCAPHRVWGLTSHLYLRLLAADDYTSRWLVSVFAHPESGYEVRYLPVDANEFAAPVLVGYGTDVEEALRMIRVAMERSGGWK